MKEANMQRFFADYLREHPPKGNEVYELKMTSGGSIPFSIVKDHQIENLQKAEQGTYYHRITDQPIFRGVKRRFTIQKPFDCLIMTKSKAYVVVWFYVPRTLKMFFKIRVGDFLKMRRYAKRKSLTKGMALGVCEEVLEI